MVDSVAEHISALDDEDWGVREDAAVALGRLGDPRSVQPLIRALRDSDRAVREAATSALKALGEPAILSLGFCLQDANPQVQESAACILADIANEQVLDPLLSAALSPNWIVRMSAAKGLSRIQNPQAIDTLILLLQDKVPAVREEAGRAIQSHRQHQHSKIVGKIKGSELENPVAGGGSVSPFETPGSGRTSDDSGSRRFRYRRAPGRRASTWTDRRSPCHSSFALVPCPRNAFTQIALD